MRDKIARIGTDGVTTMVYSDDDLELMDEGDAEVARASHVEPNPEGGWLADMGPVGGPVLKGDDGTGFRTRQEALDAERDWLDEHVLGGE